MYHKHNKINIVFISSVLKLDTSTDIYLFTPGFRQTTHTRGCRDRDRMVVGLSMNYHSNVVV